MDEKNSVWLNHFVKFLLDRFPKQLPQHGLGKAPRLAELENLAFAVLNTRDHVWQKQRNLGRNPNDAVTIPMQQITRLDAYAPESNRPVYPDHVHVGVRDSDRSRKEMEATALDCNQITNCPVGYYANATECFQNSGMNFTDKGTCARRLIHVFDDDDLGRPLHLELFPPERAIQINTALRR